MRRFAPKDAHPLSPLPGHSPPPGGGEKGKRQRGAARNLTLAPLGGEGGPSRQD
jgi:hypothetical protein